MKLKEYLLLFLILLLGFLLRIYNINWDGGFHLHPDERAIVLFTLPLTFPSSIAQFFSAQSPWNPHFFAYGSFPLYFLKILSLIVARFDASIMSYDKINLLGRVISALFDTTTIAIVFLLAKKITNIKIGFLSALFYVLSVLPIQLSHFYAVDTMLTCFITLTIFFLIQLYTEQKIRYAFFIGICLGLALATKISATAIVIPIGITIILDFLLLFLKQPHKPSVWIHHVPSAIKKLCTEGFIIGVVASIIFAICEPYAFIDSITFFSQNAQQYAMTKNAFTFPYTLQYVGKIPYIYEFKNIFLWGLGPVLAITAYIGIMYGTICVVKKEKKGIWAKEAIVLMFFWSYAAIVGHFAIGFMRYMLPVYPIFAFFGAIVFYKLFLLNPNILKKLFAICYLLFALIWPFSFIAIYQYPNTRIQATNWISQNIPNGNTIAIEHWDDGLPLINQDNYHMQTLELYNPETPEKWQKINQQLAQTNYIVIASNRLYVPLQKLTDCTHLQTYYCHRESAQYYQKLFSGKLGFIKTAEFIVRPSIPLFNIFIDDQSADESFTVYDHPKIMIFKKV